MVAGGDAAPAFRGLLLFNPRKKIFDERAVSGHSISDSRSWNAQRR